MTCSCDLEHLLHFISNNNNTYGNKIYSDLLKYKYKRLFTEI